MVPTCNLSETMHNKWLQASGNHMLDPYEATVDDYYRFAMQSIQYQNFLKGDRGGAGLDKSVLKLRAARRSGDPAKTAKAMNAVSEEAVLKSQMPHLERENIFGLVKRKLDLPPGDEFDSHRHDRVNFTIPKLGRYMTPFQCREQLKAFSEPSTPMVMTMALTKSRRHIHESLCFNQMAWRIERIEPSAKDTCQA